MGCIGYLVTELINSHHHYDVQSQNTIIGECVTQKMDSGHLTTQYINGVYGQRVVRTLGDVVTPLMDTRSYHNTPQYMFKHVRPCEAGQGSEIVLQRPITTLHGTSTCHCH